MLSGLTLTLVLTCLQVPLDKQQPLHLQENHSLQQALRVT